MDEKKKFDDKDLISYNMENQLCSLNTIDWFCGVLSRKEAEKKILLNGDFLLRLSDKGEPNFVVSTKWNEKYLHVVIKNEIDIKKKLITYHILPKYKFSTVLELISFHINNQHPLSSTNALLCHGVPFSNPIKKEHKFKKGIRASAKSQEKIIPRSGSVVMLGREQPFSTFSEMNKSLTELSTTAIDGPTKPSKRGLLVLANKIFNPRKGKTATEKHEKENGHYNDRDVVQRENFRRGQSLDFITTSVLNMDNTTSKSTCEKVSAAANQYASTRRFKDIKTLSIRSKKKSSSVFVEHNSSDSSDSLVVSRRDNEESQRTDEEKSSVYVDHVNTENDAHVSIVIQENNLSESVSQDALQDYCDVIKQKNPLKRGGSSIYVVPNPISDSNLTDVSALSHNLEMEGSSMCVMPNKNEETVIKDTINSSCNIKRNESDYVVPLTPTFVVQPHPVSRPSTIAIGSFLNLDLSRIQLSCCGSIEGTFDTIALKKVALFLLSSPHHPLSFCAHLLKEIHHIFSFISTNIASFNSGYRCLFLRDSDKCQRDLSIRQSTLTCFVMATIVCVSSIQFRSQMIVFWIQCADILLNQTKDMFHFRSVVTAIFSDHISGLKAWKTVYSQRPEIIEQVHSLRTAISHGCFMRTQIDQCLPDIVQLYRTFTSNDVEDHDFDEFSCVSVDMMDWSEQSFTETTTWLVRICKDLEHIQTTPMLRELIQTEGLLCLILGRILVSGSQVETLLQKVEECIGALASVSNHD